MVGKITKLLAGVYTVYNSEENKFYDLKPLGVFRHKDITPKVGDIVEFNEKSIIKINKRFNDLIRPNICNIDSAFVVTSVKEPDLNLNLLDRFLVILEYNDIKPILIFSKWDLVSENEKANFLEIINYYKKIGYDTIITSPKEKIDLEKYISNNVSVITGQSGAGKSSLLNIICPNINLKTDEISKALNRGKHTTRHTELLKIYDGWIADTPGFGNLEFINMNEQDLAHSMKEFFENAKSCKYNGCLHLNEPNCSIKEMVKEEKILKTRYENYLLFLEEIKKNRKW